MALPKPKYYQQYPQPAFWPEEKLSRPTIRCHRCRTIYMKGLTGADPVTQDEVIVAAHLDGWFVLEEEKYCLPCCKALSHKIDEHIKTATKIQADRKNQ